ncbi:DUF1376 domain-containing protein [Sphingomonas sp.]|jgi:hypothetical protein|uniref:DUF1376 domain-containing protein n=1 Tax=Sphingomonas sp. TaxID=28214 RepID=UPI00261501A4|nr:DUF1376 domain-containing protein [Sphingomonas sp.]MDF2493277.1 hypothetical protein [Sphingomonas sp.]
MSADLPAPLTTPDCNVQSFPYMPLHVAKLRDSDMAAEEEPEACWYNVLLCSAAWHQIPAASLPNNDAVLMRLIGLGRDLKTWKKHRRGALRGFVLCSDDRYYHPFVADLALTAWASRNASETERSAAAERQARWREEQQRMSARLRELGIKPPAKASKAVLSELLREHDPDWSGAISKQDRDAVRNVANVTRVTQTVTAVMPNNRDRTKHNGTEQIDDADADDARAGAHARRALANLAAEICQTAGIRNQSRHEQGKNEAIVARWLSQGHRLDDILAAISEALHYARTTPQSLNFFENPIAQLAHASRADDMPRPSVDGDAA